MRGWERWMLLLFCALSAMAFSSGASAAELKTPLQSCTAPNCGATLLYGRINKSDRCCGFQLSMPWVAQLYANKNECLRLHVTAQGSANTELVAIAPGTQRAWRNDNSNIQPCPTCPLLKIRTSANEEGWFVVQVNESTGRRQDSEFLLRYARYPASNPNCSAHNGPLPPP